MNSVGSAANSTVGGKIRDCGQIIEFDEYAKEAEMHVERMRILRGRVKSTKRLVSLPHHLEDNLGNSDG